MSEEPEGRRRDGVRKSMCQREGDEWALHKRGSLIFKSSRAIFSSAGPKPEGFRSSHSLNQTHAVPASATEQCWGVRVEPAPPGGWSYLDIHHSLQERR